MTTTDLPTLPTFATVAVLRPVRVSSSTGEPRTLRPEDRLTVESHKPGEPLALCKQRDGCGRRVRVPVACVRVVSEQGE